VETSTSVTRREMHSAALPLIRYEPLLKIVEPEIGPRDNRIRETQASVPLTRGRKVETQVHGVLGVDMREPPTVGQRNQIGISNSDSRRPMLPVFEADSIVPTRDRRTHRQPPTQYAGLHLTNPTRPWTVL
jgi:hypothetical protein